MVAYPFVAVEEEDTHKPLIYQEAVAWEDNHPAGQKLVSCKWIFKIKEGIEGVQKPRYKARLVARGFTQRAGIDYNEVFSSVVRHTSIRVILALTACKDYEMEKLDVKTSYVPCEYIYLLLYVYDMLIAYKSKDEIGSTKSLLKKEFDMKELGEANKIFDNEKSVKMPLGGHFKLSLKDCPVRDRDVERMSNVPYVNAVGSLMYLMVCTRPDIVYAATLQHVVALSTTETEYMALMEAVKEAIWLRGLLKELDVELNTVQEVLEAKTFKVLNVGTEHNVTDTLTKVVPELKLQHCLELLNVGVG
nr:putative ATP-dependent RNA helicase DHX37 [Tanacetum cinerariifolium]